MLYSQNQRNISCIKNTNNNQYQQQMNKQNYNTNTYQIHHHPNPSPSNPNNHPIHPHSPNKSPPTTNSYSQLLTLCQNYRKRIQYLEQQVQILKQHIKYPIDRTKQLEQQYIEHKRYMYQDYKRQKMEMKTIVEYLVGCYEEFVGGGDVDGGFQGLVREVKEDGSYKAIQRWLAPNQGLNLHTQNTKTKQNQPHTTPSSLLSPSQILDQIQSKILRKKIQTLTNILHTLTTSYKKQLKQLKEQITGKSKYMIEEIKQCIYRNFNHIKPFSCGAGTGTAGAGGRSKSGSRQDIVDGERLSGSRGKKIGRGEKQGRSSGGLQRSQVENKRLSLQHTIQIVNPRKPPLPPNPNPTKTPKTTPLSQSFNLHNTHSNTNYNTHHIFPSSSKNQQNWNTNRNNISTSTPKNSTYGYGCRTQNQSKKIKLKQKSENRRKNTEERGKDEEKGNNNGRSSWGYADKVIRF